MRKVLVICPSRGRPDALRDMLTSLEETKSPGTDSLVYLNHDDPALPEYQEKTGHLPCTFIYGPRKYMIEVCNIYSLSEPRYDYYLFNNDDHYFHTVHWDAKMIKVLEERGQGWGIVGANDLYTEWANCKHPSACMLSRKMIDALGYAIWPPIHHIGADTYFQKIAEGIGRLFLEPGIIIEHRHWLNGKRLMDDNYKWVYGQEEQRYGWGKIREYLFTQYPHDIKKLKDAIAKEQNA